MPPTDQQRARRVEFGDRIRELRMKRGLSQEQFAHIAGIDRTYLSSVERGMRNVSIDNIYRLADNLGVSVRDLF